MLGAARPMLASPYVETHDYSGWYASEKYDGVRCLYSDGVFLTRTGKRLHCPRWFFEGVETSEGEILDGELFMGYSGFESVNRLVRISMKPPAPEKRTGFEAMWRPVVYMVFDCVDTNKTGPRSLQKRCVCVHRSVPENHPHFVRVEHVLCPTTKEIDDLFERTVRCGGEGLVLRDPGAVYKHGRASCMVKRKKREECIARVVGYGVYPDRTGRVRSLVCVDAHSQSSYRVSSGLNQSLRECPPSLGSSVRIRFQERTRRNRVPRFAVYLETIPRNG